jgi:hypothetical protein
MRRNRLGSPSLTSSNGLEFRNQVSKLLADQLIAQTYLGQPIPIVTHGYDYALPDGQGYLGGFWLLPGPWLEPGFRKIGCTRTCASRCTRT